MPRDAVEDLRGLIHRLQDEAWPRRLDALREATALLAGGAIPDDDAALLADALRASVLDPKWEVRRAAAEALAEAGPVAPDAVEHAFTQLAHDANPWVRRAAEQARQRLRQLRAGSEDEPWSLTATPPDPILDYLQAKVRAIGLRPLTPQDICTLFRDAGEHSYRELAADTAHEVRSLLTPIEGYLAALAEHLEGMDPPDSKAARYTERLLDRVAQLGHLVDALHAYSSPAGQATTTVDLARVVAAAVEQARERTAREGIPHDAIRTRIEVRAGLQVEAFPDRFIRALVNLLANACQAMAEGGTLTVRAASVVTDRGKTLVRLEITDTGPGMTETEAALALQRFQTTRHDQGGTGLGLPIARRIIEEEHGGRLTLRSRPGEGTTVRVELPRHGPSPGR